MRHIVVLVILILSVGMILSGPKITGQARNLNAKTPAQLYSKNCASCHGRDGRARTLKAKLNHARDLTDQTWQGNVSDERIFNSIMNGKRKMPPYGKKLSEPEIDSLVAFVRGLKK